MTDEGAEADLTLVLGSSGRVFSDESWKGKRAVWKEGKGTSIIRRVRETEAAADLFQE